MTTKILKCEFPASKTGIATVGYTLYTASVAGSRVTAGVYEIGNGFYGCSVTWTAQDFILWDTGEATPLYAGESLTEIADTAAAKTAAESVQTQVGTAGAGLTALGDTRLANLDAKVSTRALASDLVLMSGFVELLAEGINEVKEAAESAKSNTDPLATMIADGAFTEEAMGNVQATGAVAITTKQTTIVTEG